MKVITVLGTRPELIRLSLIIPYLDQLCKHILVYTGQNFEPQLSDIFFTELNIRKPDYNLNISEKTFGKQVGRMFDAIDEVLTIEKPDAMLVLGDTNSGLSAIIAKRSGIPIFHMEAGNRCYDERVPEEVNRRIIDHASTFLMPYTQRSKENLLREGILGERIFVTGNPIFEVLSHFEDLIKTSDIHKRLEINQKKYFLVTMHRAETVDFDSRLQSLINSLEAVNDRYNLPVICSLHPRTRDCMIRLGLNFDNDRIKYLKPLGFFDFVALEKSAFCVLTDSGTVQEECSIFQIPSITIRDVTERPETVEAGSNILAGIKKKSILRAIKVVISHQAKWETPAGYLDTNVSQKVIKIVLGQNIVI